MRKQGASAYWFSWCYRPSKFVLMHNTMCFQCQARTETRRSAPVEQLIQSHHCTHALGARPDTACWLGEKVFRRQSCRANLGK